MNDVPRRFKPLYSRLLGLNIDKYLLSRDFELLAIELDIDSIWKNWKSEQAHGQKFPNYSLIAEANLGNIIGMITREYEKYVGYIAQPNGESFKSQEFFKDGYRKDLQKIRDRLLEVISRILIDFSRWNTIRSNFSSVFEALEELGYSKDELNPIMNRISKMQVNKPKKMAELDTVAEFEQDFWNVLNKRVVEASKERFMDGYYSDSVFNAIKELNYQVKRIYENKTGDQLDGVPLMRKAFSPINNVILVSPDLESVIGKDIQEGFMQLYAGSSQAIRNPNAHANMKIEKDVAVHYLFLISLLMNRLENAKY